MGQLIDDLLEFSRMGRSQVNTQRVSLNDLVRDAHRELFANGNGSIDANDCAFGVAGSANVLGSDPSCGNGTPVPAAVNGHVDVTSWDQPRVRVHAVKTAIVHDLLAIEMDAASLLPPDEQAYGFDTNADALTIAPAFL